MNQERKIYEDDSTERVKIFDVMENAGNDENICNQNSHSVGNDLHKFNFWDQKKG